MAQSPTSRVLVIEDHDDTRAALVLALSRAGFGVIEAADGREGFERLVVGDDVPVLIVLDLELPIMSGWEFLSLVRSYARFADVPVLVVSAREPPATAINASDTRTSYLSKPFDPDELIAFANTLARSDSSGHWRV